MKKILTFLITTVLGTVMIVAQAQNPETRDEQTRVEVYFRTNEEETEPENPVDPEGPGPEGPGTGMSGPLSIDYISHFLFGGIDIVAQDMTYTAGPDVATDGSDLPNFIQVTDNRIEIDREGWILTVEQLQPLTNTDNHSLIGSILRLRNMIPNSSNNFPAPRVNNDLDLTPGIPDEIARADNQLEDGAGRGTWFITFGTAQEVGVELFIPEDVEIQPYTYYSARLRWVLSDSPL